MAETIHQEKEIEKSFDSSIMKRLMHYAKSQWLLLGISIILMLLVTALDLAIPYVTKIAIDEYISPKQQQVYTLKDDPNVTLASDLSASLILPSISEKVLGTYKTTAYEPSVLYTEDGVTYLVKGMSRSKSLETFKLANDGQTATLDGVTYKVKSVTATELDVVKANNKHQILVLTLTLGSLLVMSFFCAFGHTYLLNYGSQKIVYNMREELYSHIQNMSLSFFDKNPVGRLVTRVSNDMDNINEMFTNVLVTSIKDFLLLIGTLVVMSIIDFKLTLICFSTMPLVLISASIFRKKARNVQREVKVKLAKINATLAENINGMKIIQIFNKEKDIYEDFDAINTDFLKSTIAETRVYAIFRPTMNLAYSLSLGLLLWFGGGDAIKGAVELGVLVAFITYTQQFFRPIMDLSEKFNILQSSMASAERIFMLLDEKESIVNPVHPVPLANASAGRHFSGEIAFEDVWFSYQANPQTDDDYVLKGVSFKAGVGESIALVGATGSGKTTIISLLNRFYDIQKGRITIDGVDIRDVDKHKLREHIGIVLQDVFLFSGDIKSNIRLYNESITDENIKEIAKYVNADGFISKLPLGYDEPVVERGATLSAGQRQLLSFARALVFDPGILILDEATSNIDTETELLIQDAINKIIKGRTTLIVAHRLSTIQHASKIIVMSKGEIKEMGNHQELLSKRGMYYDLYTLQYSESVYN